MIFWGALWQADIATSSSTILSDDSQTDKGADSAQHDASSPIDERTVKKGEGISQQSYRQLNDDVSYHAARNVKTVSVLGKGENEPKVDDGGQRDAGTSADQPAALEAHYDGSNKENGVDGLDEKIRQRVAPGKGDILDRHFQSAEIHG